MSRDAKEGVVAVSGDETKTSVIEVIVKQTLLQKMKISQILLKNLVN